MNVEAKKIEEPKIITSEKDLSGKLVTALHQTHKIQSNQSISIRQIFESSDLQLNFDRMEFPNMQKTSDDVLWFEPCKSIVDNGVVTKHIWILLDKNMKISHNYNFAFIPFLSEGYLMKIVMPITRYCSDTFQIAWLININDINIEINNVVKLNGIKDDNVDVTQKEFNRVISLNLEAYPELYIPLSNAGKFYNSYLKTFL